MGYEVYITRPPKPSADVGPTQPITAADLEGLVQFNPADGCYYCGALCLRLEEGCLCYKSPSEQELELMAQLAQRLGAQLLGEDGQAYPFESKPSRPRGWWHHLSNWFDRKCHPIPSDSPFVVGERVRCIVSGRCGHISGLEGGSLPKMLIVFDNGTTSKQALMAHSLEKL